MLTDLIKNNKYKILISIIFGLLGFFVNFHTIIFPFGEYTAAILLGLLFPMLITLSWGWKYGLLSALAGGCQTMWWLWGPSNGYAIFLVVPPFTLWIIWHGFFANLRKKQKTHKWWLSMYIVEIPFRILSSINLLTLSRWAITLNPPSWSWASNASNTIPMHFSIFVTIKQAAVGLVVLLLADVLLNISHVRRFFKLKEYIDYKKTGYIISSSLLLGCLFWLLDSIFYSFAFHREGSFIDLLALDIPNYNIFIRTIFFIFCLMGGLITSRILRKQREGEIALQESEEELSQIIEGNSIATFVINKEHKVTNWNKAVENLSGFPAGKMIGTKNQWKPFYSEERPLMSDIIVNELSDKEIKKYYTEKYRKSSLVEGAFEAEDFFPNMGEEGKWLFFTAAPLKDHNGKIIGAIETLQDITKRKRIESKLKQNENMLRQIIDTTPNCIYVKDRNGMYLVVNKKMVELHNTTPEELVGKYDYEIAQKWFETVDYDEFRKTEQDVIDNKKTLFINEELFVYNDGTERWYQTTKIPLELEDDQNRLLIISTDITERKQAEDEIKISRERLRHDLVNDFAVIRSALRLYKSNSKINMLNEIEKRVAKSLDTIKRLREQESFIDSHSDLNEYDIIEVLNDVITDFPDVNIHIEGSGTAFADEALYSVFDNLINNAIEHGISKKIDISISTNNQFCEIRFKDHGTGIPDEIKDKIFDEGFIYGNKGHTGIGLYIVKQTIEGYGGNITVENNKPKGAIFVISLRKVIEK